MTDHSGDKDQQADRNLLLNVQVLRTGRMRKTASFWLSAAQSAKSSLLKLTTYPGMFRLIGGEG